MNDVPHIAIQNGEPDRQILRTIDRFLNGAETVVETDLSLYEADPSSVYAKLNTGAALADTDIGHLHAYWFANDCFSLQFFGGDKEEEQPLLHWFHTRESDGIKVSGSALEDTETIDIPASLPSDIELHPVTVLSTVLAIVDEL